VRFIKYEPGQNPNPGCMVEVICDDRSHPGRVARLGMFVKSDADPNWRLWPQLTSVAKRSTPWGQTDLRDDTPLEPTADLPEGSGGLRRRFQVRCDLCTKGFTYRAETLGPVLDTLAEHAEAWEIELVALRARVEAHRRDGA
jgi:hypothetical protein